MKKTIVRITFLVATFCSYTAGPIFASVNNSDGVTVGGVSSLSFNTTPGVGGNVNDSSGGQQQGNEQDNGGQNGNGEGQQDNNKQD